MKCANVCSEAVRKQIMEEIRVGASTEQGTLVNGGLDPRLSVVVLMLKE